MGRYPHVRIKPKNKTTKNISSPSDLLSTGGTKDDKAPSESLRLILVVFLGGCTFSEISALRFLGREKGERERKER